MSTPIVSVFGSSRLVEGDAEYDDARAVGHALAAAGWTVATGGYGGVMEAACRGAVEAGGATIGVTVAGWGERSPNRWVQHARPGSDLFDRMRILIDGADALVAVAGGVGTLAEVATAWNLMQHRVRDGGDPRPLALMGPRWRSLVESLGREVVDGPADRDLVVLCDGPADVVRAVGRPRGVA